MKTYNIRIYRSKIAEENVREYFRIGKATAA